MGCAVGSATVRAWQTAETVTRVDGPASPTVGVICSTAHMTLRAATIVFGIGFVLHHADHVRRGYGVVEDGVILGRTVAAMLVAVLFTLVATRHPWAPLGGAAIGAIVAVGLVIVRIVPPFGPPSDHLGADGIDALTWFVVLFELVGAVVVAAVGLRELRHRPAYQS